MVLREMSSTVECREMWELGLKQQIYVPKISPSMNAKQSHKQTETCMDAYSGCSMLKCLEEKYEPYVDTAKSVFFSNVSGYYYLYCIVLL